MTQSSRGLLNVVLARVGLVAGLLLGGALAGCLIGADPLEDRPEEDPEEGPTARISSISLGKSESESCSMTTSPTTRDCWSARFHVVDLRCDPPQFLQQLFTEDPLPKDEFRKRATQGTFPLPEGSSDGYVYCEYALEWVVTARSEIREGELRVEVQLDDRVEESTCRVARGGECSLEGRLEGSLSIDEAGIETSFHSRMDAVLEGPELPMVFVDRDTLDRTYDVTVRTK